VHDLDQALVPDLNRQKARLGGGYCANLVNRDGVPIGLHAHRIQETGARAPRPEPSELVFERIERAFHPAGHLVLAVFVRHLPLASYPARPPRPQPPPPKIVARPSPRNTAAKAPYSRIEKTMIGIPFCRKRLTADASMT